MDYIVMLMVLWGTDEHDGKNIAEILRGIGEMVAIIIGAKKR